MAGRLKGQEVEIGVMQDSVVLRSVTAIKSADLNWELEQLEEGYLGETTMRYDTIYNGVSGSMEFHCDNFAIFELIKKILDRARRREPGLSLTIKFRATLDDGTQALIAVPDPSWGQIPMSVGGRKDFVSFKLDFKASDAFVVRS